MSPSKALPTPRRLLSDLIASASSPPITREMSSGSNPLQNAPPQVRSVLTTLHIIFPHLLLPALDLLDRQLVTKLLPQPSPTLRSSIQEPRAASSSSVPPTSFPDNTENEGSSFYMVQSSQSTSRRHQKSYTIRLHAWNCTCASFVFSSFPPSTSSSTALDFTDFYPAIIHEAGDEKKEKAADASKWEFGGASMDGKNGGAVPACKHLLACVLADRWSVLGGMVQESRLGSEEMAGLGAGL